MTKKERNPSSYLDEMLLMAITDSFPVFLICEHICITMMFLLVGMSTENLRSY